MAWGGSLNKNGSDHLRNLREADKAMKFLERLKGKLSEKDKKIVSDTIDIIVSHYTKES
ncbi:MAG: hypothetical protein ACXABG_05955 [Promethearchaeota archaeon]|jgi:hypothetical protein